jgi:hypothetical protein
MTHSNDSRPSDGHRDAQPEGNEQERAGHSGEGAASALAHLKTQTRQHRRQIGDADEMAGGSSQ